MTHHSLPCFAFEVMLLRMRVVKMARYTLVCKNQVSRMPKSASELNPRIFLTHHLVASHMHISRDQERRLWGPLDIDEMRFGEMLGPISLSLGLTLVAELWQSAYGLHKPHLGHSLPKEMRL